MAYTATTDKNGKYTIVVDYPGDFDVSADHDYYDAETQEATVGLNETAVEDFELNATESGYAVSGTVTDDDGVALEAADVWAVDVNTGDTAKRTTTDANGDYSLELPSGDYDLKADKEDYAPEARTISVTGSRTEDFTLSPTTTILYDFETGDVSRWDLVNNLSAVTDRIHAGSYAGYSYSSSTSGNPLAEETLPGSQPTKLEFWWQETTYGYGCGLRLFNSNGDMEVGLATFNPEWGIDDANGFAQVKGDTDNYDRWIRFTITFDWAAGTFDVDMEDPTAGTMFVDSGRPLKAAVDIDTLQLANVPTNDPTMWLRADDQLEMWWDDIRLTYPANDVTGTVVDDGGTAIEGADVWVTYNGATVKSTTTDANGDYALKLPSDDYDLIADKNGYIRESRTISLTDDRVEDFTLESITRGVLTPDTSQSVPYTEVVKTGSVAPAWAQFAGELHQADLGTEYHSPSTGGEDAFSRTYGFAVGSADADQSVSAYASNSNSTDAHLSFMGTGRVAELIKTQDAGNTVLGRVRFRVSQFLDDGFEIEWLENDFSDAFITYLVDDEV